MEEGFGWFRGGSGFAKGTGQHLGPLAPNSSHRQRTQSGCVRLVPVPPRAACVEADQAGAYVSRVARARRGEVLDAVVRAERRVSTLPSLNGQGPAATLVHVVHASPGSLGQPRISRLRGVPAGKPARVLRVR